MIILNVQRLYFDSVILTSILYPISTHWCWSNGWLAARGFIDFAGSGVYSISNISVSDIYILDLGGSGGQG